MSTLNATARAITAIANTVTQAAHHMNTMTPGGHQHMDGMTAMHSAGGHMDSMINSVTPEGGHHHNMDGMKTMTESGVHHHMTTDGGNVHHHMTESDHSGHGASGHDTFFTIGEKVTLLFKNFTVIEDDLGNFITACVVIFIIAALYEGLKVFREILLRNHSVANRGYEASDLEKRGSTVPLAGVDHDPKPSWCTGWHVFQAFLHIIQVTTSYILMLLVMTFNVWIGLSVVLGAGFGYLIFAGKRTTTIDVNEHCH